MQIPIKVAIIDDEPHSLELTTLMLDQLPFQFEKVIPCIGSQEGLMFIDKEKPSLILLDIEMPVMNGFTLLEQVTHHSFSVIFITAYDKYSIQAFKTSAIDYLLKPIKLQDLKEAVSKYVHNKMIISTEHFSFLLNQIKDVRNKTIQKIALPSLDGIQFFKVSEIEAFEAHESVTYLYDSEGKRSVINLRFQQIMEKLGTLDFYQTHRSFLLNLSKIGSIKKGEGLQVYTESGKEIPISRRRKHDFLEIIENLSLH